MSNHSLDFGTSATWIFSATGHGKDEVDGVGGKMKTVLRENSLMQGIHNTLLDANGIHDFIKLKNYKIKSLLVTEEEIRSVEEKYKERWSFAKTINGTHDYHDYSVDPENNEFLFVKKFSKSNDLKRVKILRTSKRPDPKKKKKK